MTDGGGSPGGTITLERGDAGWVARLTGEVDAAVVQTFSSGGSSGRSSASGGTSGEDPGAGPVGTTTTEPAAAGPLGNGREGSNGSDVLVTVVDAAEVTFIDSSGLALMLRWATRARDRGSATELRSPSEAVLTLLRISGTRSLFAGAEAGDTPGEVAAAPAAPG